MKAKFLMIATAVTVLTACSNDENVVNDGPVEAKVTAGLGTETRAVNTNNEWNASDKIGVMVTSVTGTPAGVTSLMVDRYKNVEYTATSGGTTATFTAVAGAGIFFQDATETVTFAAYYPYQTTADASTLPGTSGAVTVNTKDNNTKDTQANIDFLFASGATASRSSATVEFKKVDDANDHQFKHKMSRLILILKTSETDGFTADQVFGSSAVYKLGGLKHEGTFKVTDGTAAVSASANVVTDWTITSNVKVDNSTDKTRTYTLILLPQDLSSSPLTFTATVGGQTYTNATSINPNLAAGTSYTYTITLKKTGLTVSGCTIAAWTTGTGGSGNAEM